MILVDDGLATGSTMRAAVKAVREHRPSKVVVAVPAGAADTCEELWPAFRAVGLWYEEFPQISDEQVRDLLERSSRELVDRES